MTNAQALPLGVLILGGVIVVAIGRLLEDAGFIIPFSILTVVAGGFVWHKIRQRKKRLKYLRD